MANAKKRFIRKAYSIVVFTFLLIFNVNCAWPLIGAAVAFLTGDKGGGSSILLPPSDPGTTPLTTTPGSLLVSSSNSNGAYKAGTNLTITVGFPEKAVVSGTPQISLNNGGTANFSAGSGTKTLSFSYTVSGGEDVADLDYSSVSAFSLNGGSIKNSSGSDLSITLPTPGAAGSLGASKDLTIDTIAPSVFLVGTSLANGTYGVGQAGSVLVVFTESVTVTGTPTINLNVGRSVSYASGSASTILSFDFTVTSPDATSALDYVGTTSLSDGGGTLRDSAGNDASLTLAFPGTPGSISQAKTITIDTAGPTITNVTSSTSNGVYGIAASISIQVEFSEAVSVTGTPTLTLETGGTDETISYSSGSGSNTLTFTYTVINGDISSDLEVASASSLSLAGGTINDLVSNPAALTLPTSGSGISLSDNKALVISTASPTVSFNSASLSVGEATSTLNIPVDLSSVSASTVTVDYTVTGVTATGAGTDYTLASGTLTFNSPSVSENIVLSVANDTLDESDETLTITLSSPSNAVLGATTVHTVTINDDDNPPDVYFSSSSSSSPDESSNNRTITISLSQASGTTVSVLVTDSGGTATSSTDYSDIGSPLTVAFSPGQTSQTVTIAVLQDTIYEGNETVVLGLSSPTNATVVSPSTHTFTITDDEVGILSAETIDSDNDGKIDHYKLVFSESVDDSTFPGYALNSLGTSQSDWFVAGYSNVVLAHGTAAPVSDTANDSIIYIKFSESSSYDSGAKPDLTTSSTPGLLSSAGAKTVGRIFTASVTEADRAKPAVVAASANAGSTSLTVIFSEAVYGAGGAPACSGSGDLSTSVLTFNDGNAAGATSLSGMGSDVCASDSGFNAVFLSNFAFASGDNNVDTVAGNANLYDAANNTGNTSAKSITVVSGPSIQSVTQYDTNKNGKIDQIKIVFSESIDDSTVDNADAAQFAISGVTANRVDSTTSGTGTIASPNNDPGTANDSIVTIFTDDSTVSGTDIKLASFTMSSGRWKGGVSGVETATVSDLTSVTLDKAPPVLLTAVASDNSVSNISVDSDDTVILTFSESTDKPVINSSNIDSILQLSSSHTWGTISSAVWNAAGDSLTVTFAGSGSTISVGDTITILGTITDNASVPNTSTNIAAVNPVAGSFYTDTIAPYIVSVVNITPNSVTISYSESMKMDGTANAANNPGNYSLTEASSDACTDPVISSVTSINSTTVQINLSTNLCDIYYRIAVTSNVVDLGSPTPNPMGTPYFLTFLGNDRLKVVSALSLGTNTVKVILSRAPVAGNDSTGTAGCTTSTECGYRYKFSPSLGSITSATLGGSLSNEITITHSSPQTGSAYSVIVANNVDGDGFDNTSWGSLLDANTLLSATERQVKVAPQDRASFTGSGTAVTNFSGGSYFSDPFTDGTVFSFAFNFGGKVYLGTNDVNNAAFRFDPNGQNSILTTFSFSAGVCTSATGFGYGSGTTCGTNMGPNGERGVVGFNSAIVTIGGTNYEILMVGPLKDGVTRGYFTQSSDLILPWSEFGFSATGGSNTKSVQTLYAVDNHLYMGLSSAHGTQAPILTHHSLSASSGVISVASGTDMNFRSLDNLGKGASVNNLKNTSKVVGIDAIVKFNSALYVANNGGVRYSTDFTSFSSSVLSTPSGFSGTTLVLPPQPSGLEKVNPGKKGIPKLLVYNGRLYMARNVASGSTCTNTDTLQACQTNSKGELWKCEPGTVGGATTCEPGDWSLIISGTESDLGTSNAISILQNNGSGILYVGFDDPTNGVRIFRINSTNPSATSGTMSGAGWSQQGTNGLGTVSPLYLKFISSTSISDGAFNYIYVTAGTGTDAIKVFRQLD
ncbi:hypothetical protein CH373_08720 [Leptospira perolatii]|uniref:Calx-beta domain-containing protein n=1 Tax=Leptospira perolatii TaxID=2023191 RepID=A0A2M9ZNR6_9LEPT|nr:Calx-beta domain-containing protein [Leptospira perolatii]PJZ69586.1 hypothetical protein CH360_09865 [Leptospira perolatii]PJZ73573.1 hypothetical protein CH373_08720 [Leptospira perolatii]